MNKEQIEIGLPTNPRFISEIGKVFGRLTVLQYVGSVSGSALWLCQCKCGKLAKVRGYCLRRGHSKSCGCLTSESFHKTITVHGKSRTIEHRAWTALRKRCLNPNGPTYNRYGGRGITVCVEWDSFEQFLEDMGPRPSDRHSIDRIDNNGPYCKENCRWATKKEQATNRSTSRFIEHNGERLTVTEWSERLHIKQSLIHDRIRAGWTFAEIFTTPARKLNKATSQYLPA